MNGETEEERLKRFKSKLRLELSMLKEWKRKADDLKDKMYHCKQVKCECKYNSLLEEYNEVVKQVFHSYEYIGRVVEQIDASERLIALNGRGRKDRFEQMMKGES